MQYGAVDGYLNVPRSNFTAFTQAVVMHPVATAICCGPYLDYWHAYTGGIMDIEGGVASTPSFSHVIACVRSPGYSAFERTASSLPPLSPTTGEETPMYDGGSWFRQKHVHACVTVVVTHCAFADS